MIEIKHVTKTFHHDDEADALRENYNLLRVKKSKKNVKLALNY